MSEAATPDTTVPETSASEVSASETTTTEATTAEATTPEATSEEATATEAKAEAVPAEDAAPADTASESGAETQAETTAATEGSEGTDAPDPAVAESAEPPGLAVAGEVPAADRPPIDLVATQAAVSSALAADPLAQPAPEAVHEVAIEPELPEGKHVLVIEPDSQVRGSLAGGCRTHPWLSAHTASSVDLGEDVLKEERIEAIVLSLEEGPEAIDLLIRIRRGECQVDAGVPVMATIQEATAERVVQLKALGVARLLVRPFTLGDALETLEKLWTPDGQPVELPVDPKALEEQQEPAVEAEAPAETAAEEASDAEGDASVAPAAASEIPSAEAVAEPVAEPA